VLEAFSRGRLPKLYRAPFLTNWAVSHSEKMSMPYIGQVFTMLPFGKISTLPWLHHRDASRRYADCLLWFGIFTAHCSRQPYRLEFNSSVITQHPRQQNGAFLEVQNLF
jgi:hypothetical protein